MKNENSDNDNSDNNNNSIDLLYLHFYDTEPRMKIILIFS